MEAEPLSYHFNVLCVVVAHIGAKRIIFMKINIATYIITEKVVPSFLQMLTIYPIYSRCIVLYATYCLEMELPVIPLLMKQEAVQM